MRTSVPAASVAAALAELDFPHIGLEIEALEDGRLALRQIRPQRQHQRERVVGASVERRGRCAVVFADAVRTICAEAGDVELATAEDGSLLVRHSGVESRLPPLPPNFAQLPSHALMDVTHDLYAEAGERGYRKVKLTMTRDGALRLEGEDSGPQVEAFFASDEYSWTWSLAARDVPALFASLGLDDELPRPGQVLVADERLRLLQRLASRLLQLEREGIQKQFEAARASFSSWH